jgi:hypothetical protein
MADNAPLVAKYVTACASVKPVFLKAIRKILSQIKVSPW